MCLECGMLINCQKKRTMKNIVKEEIREFLSSEKFDSNYPNIESTAEDCADLADCLFEVLGISSSDQDKVGAKVIVSPLKQKVRVTISGGVATVVYKSVGVEVEIIDYDNNEADGTLGDIYKAESLINM